MNIKKMIFLKLIPLMISIVFVINIEAQLVCLNGQNYIEGINTEICTQGPNATCVVSLTFNSVFFSKG